MAKSLLVHEIYLSIQGESTFAGLPCAFVRLTDYDLRCSYCDTAYTFKGGQPMSLDDIVLELENRCEFTGEPANILSLTPPLTIGKTHITRLVRALGKALEDAYV